MQTTVPQTPAVLYNHGAMGFENVGRVWTPATLREYLTTVKPPAWAKAIVLHHTAAPSLAQRPDGFLAEHLKNIQHFYSKTLGWSTGPHLFVDDDQIWGMCPLTKYGIHAAKFNRMSLGIEVLGDYDRESNKTGRGLACWQTCAATTSLLLDWLKLPANEQTVLFHREDPTAFKTCPGTKLDKPWVLDLIKKADPKPVVDVPAKPDIGVRLEPAQWRFIGERWVVPVRAYLLKKGVKDAQIAENLKRDGGQFAYAGDVLEGAFYDKESSATWAPVRELMELRLVHAGSELPRRRVRVRVAKA